MGTDGRNDFAHATDGERPAYIARHSCGGIVMATVDNPHHADNVAREVADCIRRGETIERVKVAEARAGEWCGCAKP